VCAIEQMYPVL